MSHLPADNEAGRHKRSDCKKGIHLYGASQRIGGGIVRQVCQVCGEVTIDLTGAEPLSSPIIVPTVRIGSLTSEG